MCLVSEGMFVLLVQAAQMKLNVDLYILDRNKMVYYLVHIMLIKLLFVSAVRVNGFACKNPTNVSADDFFKAAMLDKPRDTAVNKVGSNITLINVMEIPGLNTLGISIVRVDYAPLGLNPPHTHPRATEIFTVLEGTLYVGFVTSNPDNKLFSKVLNKGDVFVFPKGLIHFQSTLTPISPQSLPQQLVAKILGLLLLQMQCSDQTHRSRMIFWPRHFRWIRRL
jgi:quercetin dioxygenase-like cupin family protein